MIDIVVTYVDNSIKSWQKEYFKYEKQENINTDDEQLNPQIRFRDTGTFKYFFRSVDKNCPWIGKIFLVVKDKDHVPKWLNLNNPKLKVVFHEDFIPHELLPTFNSNVIEFFIYRISGLENNYILCNDDTFFNSPVDEKFFFRSGKPVYDKVKTLPRRNNNLFDSTIINNQDVIKAISGVDEWYIHRHHMTPHLKLLEYNLVENNLDLFIDSFKDSKFRNENNYTPWLFNELCKALNLGVNVPGLYKNCNYVTLSSKLNLDKYKNSILLCINDTAKNDNFKISKNIMETYLSKKFIRKCQYEL